MLKYWNEIEAFKKQLEMTKGLPEYTFYDGPPFATGLPHYGHIAAGTIKVRTQYFKHKMHTKLEHNVSWLVLSSYKSKDKRQPYKLFCSILIKTKI